MEIDDEGLDSTDRKLLAAIIQKFASGPVGVAALAAVLSEEVETIEDVYEPFLLRLGFLDRTPQGRIATEAARDAPRRARLRDPAAAPSGAGHAPLWDDPRLGHRERVTAAADRAAPAHVRGPRRRRRPDGRRGRGPGRLTLPHGVVETPQFMPVGTNATVKALDPDDLREVGRARSSSPTPTTCTCGPATSGSRGSAACTGSWTGTARSSPTRAASRSSRSATCGSSTTTA